MDEKTLLQPTLGRNSNTHIMVDLETMGTSPGSAILALAAVQFITTTFEPIDSFYVQIDLKSSVQAGFKVEADTVLWWLRQSEAARSEATSGECPIDEALNLFSQWLDRIQPSIESRILYGNGSSFDLGILGSAYRALDEDIPWRFYNERDLRSYVSLNPEIKKTVPFEGTPHNALHDAIHQVRYLGAVMKTVRILPQSSS